VLQTTELVFAAKFRSLFIYLLIYFAIALCSIYCVWKSKCW